MAGIVEEPKNGALIIGPGDDRIEAEVVYHFDRGYKRPAPRISGDGSVNYRDLGILNLCGAGDVLVSVGYTPAGDMDPGFIEGCFTTETDKLDLRPLMGGNTILSSDGRAISAAISGMVLIKDGKVSVSDSIVINKDVNNATGDIIFPGTVYVKGNVRGGFTVKADAGLRVGGVVEAASLETNGDLTLDSGVRGAHKAVLKAGGNVKANFLESCTVSAGGDITADSILHSQVMCGGSLTLSGKRGLLVGGRAIAGREIDAIAIGAAVSTPTEVYAGRPPEIVLLYQRLMDDYAETRKRYEEAGKSVNTLISGAALTADRKKTLLKTLRVKLMLKEKLKDLRKRFDIVIPAMGTGGGKITARSIMHYGVKVTIGGAVMYIRDALASSVLTNIDGKINIGIYSKGGV